MARKVFISILGTGYYDACKYAKDSFISSETRFIQQATLEYLKVNRNWTTQNSDGDVIDRIIILLTEGARETNWNKEITKRLNRKTGQEESYRGLEQVLDDMELSCPVETLSIPDGKSEEEMWEIFNLVYEKLKPNDELYFDLTHSFRYLPMLVLVLGNYAKFLKNVSVKHISYGNYEARDTNTNIAPLMDVLPLSILQDWTFAAADLIQNGNISKLQELKDSSALVPLLRIKSQKNIERRLADEPLTNYIDALRDFLLDMKLCLAPNIINGTTINRIVDSHEQVSEVFENVIAPIPPVLNKIQDSLSGFEKTDEYSENLINGYAAAKWCYDHQLYQQAITILDENITTDFCHRLGTDEWVYEQRNATNTLLRYGEYRDVDWKKKNKDEGEDADWEEVKQIAQKSVALPQVLDFISLMRWDAVWIHNTRNTYNHASMTQDKEKMLSVEDIVKLGKIINRVLARIR